MEERHEERVSEEREIPCDVYELEILTHLPATNLQTLKSVSKHWLELISSSYFVRLHHSRAYRSRIRVLIPHASAIIEYNNYDYDQDKKQIPYSPNLSGFTPYAGSKVFVGSVDGLVCMFDQRIDQMTGRGALFNPSTGKYLELWPHQDPPLVHCYWFGKSVEGEYLLVTLVILYPGARYEFRVFKLTSSNNAEYRYVAVDLFVPGETCFSIHQRGTLVNGAVHWPVRRIVDERLHFSVLAYDIHENKHWEMLPPVEGCYLRLGVNVDGCLLAIVTNASASAFEVWIMPKKESSWTKRANIVEGFKIDVYIELSPLGFFPNGDLIYDLDKEKLMKYSFRHNAATVLMEYGCRTFDAIMCADTLVSPTSNSDC